MISRFLKVTSVLFLGVLLILAAPSFFSPEFEVKNESPGAVSVTAAWRNSSKEIGEIESMSSMNFTINDEAAIIFMVKYDDGKIVESEELYFTSGSKVIATISSNGVEVRYDSDK